MPTILERLPELTDKELANLHANAVRLSQSGAPRQKTAAIELLPPVDEEIARRSARAIQQKAETLLRRREEAAARKASGVKAPRSPKRKRATA